MWFDRSLFAGLLLVAAWGVQSAACGGAVVFDGPWPGGSGGTGGAGGATASTAATGTGAAGGGVGTGPSVACTNRACSGMEGFCDCTETCPGFGDIEVDCTGDPGSAGCECLVDGGLIGSCSQSTSACDPPTSCCNAVFFGHGG